MLWETPVVGKSFRGNTTTHDHECGCGHEHGKKDDCCGACDHEEPVRKTTVKPRQPNTTGIAGDGDVVLIHYRGTFDTGEEFDSSLSRDPLEVTIGEHAIIRGFEQGVAGMRKGEKKRITIEAKDAYGDENPELRQAVPKEAFGDIKPEEGMMLALQHPAAPAPIPVRVVKVEPDTITIDMNHPLAGKRLNFELELVEIK